MLLPRHTDKFIQFLFLEPRSTTANPTCVLSVTSAIQTYRHWRQFGFQEVAVGNIYLMLVQTIYLIVSTRSWFQNSFRIEKRACTRVSQPGGHLYHPSVPAIDRSPYAQWIQKHWEEPGFRKWWFFEDERENPCDRFHHAIVQRHAHHLAYSSSNREGNNFLYSNKVQYLLLK